MSGDFQSLFDKFLYEPCTATTLAQVKRVVEDYLVLKNVCPSPTVTVSEQSGTVNVDFFVTPPTTITGNIVFFPEEPDIGDVFL